MTRENVNTQWQCLLSNCKEEGNHISRFWAHVKKEHASHARISQLGRDITAEKEEKEGNKKKSNQNRAAL